MKKQLLLVLLSIFVVMSAGSYAAGPGGIQGSLIKAIDASAASDKVKAYTKKSLLPLCTNTILVKETKAQNNKKMSLDEIKKIDREWQDAEDELPVQKEKLTNLCARELKRIVSATTLVEVFVMDNQGAVVGENSLTSDYWQGDEEKWTNSYNGGKGGLDVSKVKFDKSANQSLQQVSLPVIDEAGKVIGAITCGIPVNKL